jgi:CRISPR-associated endonuclease/helicase Cas3
MTELPAYYAHSLEGRPEEEWEPLDTHLRHVAKLAGEFAAAFGAGEWGHLAGLWHDLGKFRPEFQRLIRGERVQTEHAGIGAALAAERALGSVAFVIAGHHAGLANRVAQGSSSVLPLKERLAANRAPLDRVRSLIAPEILNAPSPALPKRFAGLGTAAGRFRSIEFWTRMLFSALVDADFLATEHFVNPSHREKRSGGRELSQLQDLLTAHLNSFDTEGEVNRVRHAVLGECVAASMLPPGLFSLTVPTGGGKTLSAMAFALRHAGHHNLRRVVVAIPFTSIIEQNARVYRNIFGDDSVVEHHSQLDEETLQAEYGEREVRRQLATENWDAPVVVTTNVQLFESLFANRTSGCRKLHNLARSVIIIDEAQALPAGFLLPVLDSIRELTEHYGCSVVLTTATQPALERRGSLPQGLTGLREIVADPALLSRRLDRITVQWPTDRAAEEWPDIARRVDQHERVLAIVHKRRDARELYQLLAREDRFHLSALMCPAHRLDVLDSVKAQLRLGKACCLVATQVVEAGVDIDFPVVFRAIAGLDSLIQAAGRCNREGRLRNALGELTHGHFEIFRAPTSPPPGILRRGLEVMETMLTGIDRIPALTHPDWIQEYFRRLYMSVTLDIKDIQASREQLDFATVGDEFRLIANGAVPVIVPWHDAMQRLERHRSYPTRQSRRALQPYAVQLYAQEISTLMRKGALEEVAPELFALTTAYHSLYDSSLGLRTDGGPDPASLIV